MRAKHVRGEGERVEQLEDRAVAHIKTTGIGAEGRHDEAAAIAGEAPPAHRSPALRHARDRMQMACDLAVAGGLGRFVAQRQRTERKSLGEAAANIRRQIGIVIAGDPEPIASALERFERGAVGQAHARGPVIVVKAVAERNHQPRRVALDEAGKPRQIGGKPAAADVKTN